MYAPKSDLRSAFEPLFSRMFSCQLLPPLRQLFGVWTRRGVLTSVIPKACLVSRSAGPHNEGCTRSPGSGIDKRFL